jgi:hypothetical protein
LNIAGNAKFAGAVTDLATLDVSGTSNIGANITTTGTQIYTGGVTLSASPTLAGSTMTFGSTIAGGGYSLDINGNTVFSGAVTNVNLLDVSGTSSIGANITTIGNQIYGNTINLATNAVLTGTDFLPGANIQGNNRNLTLNFTAPTDITRTTIDGAPFAGSIAGITTGGGGITNLSNIAGDINQFVSQTYNDQTEILFGNVTLDTSAAAVPGNITFGGQVSGAGKNLTLNTGTADIDFQSGTANQLGAIEVTNARNFTISSGTVSGTTFDLTGTGTADFGTTLRTAGDATINAYNAYGRVEIGGTLHLNTQRALRPGTVFDGLTGWVNGGLTGEPGARAIDVVNRQTLPLGPGTHFFDQIDLYTFAPPIPPNIIPGYPYIINEEEDIPGMLSRLEGPPDLITVKPVKELYELIEELPDSCVQAFLGKSQFDLPCAEALLRLNKSHIALMLFYRVLTRNPESFRARIGLIKCYIKLGMYNEAREELILLRNHVKAFTLNIMIDKIIVMIDKIIVMIDRIVIMNE